MRIRQRSGVKAVAWVVVVHPPGRRPSRRHVFCPDSSRYCCARHWNLGNVEFELETVFPRRLISHGNAALAETGNFAEFQNRAVGVERVQIDAVHRGY